MSAPQRTETGRVRVYCIYFGDRTDALFDAGSGTVEVKTGPLKGKHFGSPSGAGAAVIQARNPERHGSTNGWKFWRVASTGEELGTLRAGPTRKMKQKASSST